MKDTITIEVPVGWAAACSKGFSGISAEVREAAKAALKERKDGYTRWKETVFQRNVREALDRDGWSTNNARLMAAALEMLDALIVINRELDPDCVGIFFDFSQIVQAIRAALPEDVADEVLEEVGDEW